MIATGEPMAQPVAARAFPDAAEPLLDAPEYLIASVQRLNREQMEQSLRLCGLKLTTWRILSCLDERGATSLLDLAELSVIERTVASRLVDRLVGEGMVRKQAMSQDKRFSLVDITAKGRRALSAANDRVRDVRAQLFHGFSEAEYDEMRGYLRRLRQNARMAEF